MSITGTLVGYENNNDLCNKKNRSLLNVTSASSKQCTSLNSSISNSVITTASNNISASKSNHDNSNNEYVQTKIKKRKHRFHLNTLWSIWYGVLFTYLQGYLILNGAYRYLGCYLVQWRSGDLPLIELNAQIILCLFGLLMLPIFFISAIFKVGNFANDGIKLATSTHGKCSAEPEDGLEHEAKGGTLRAIFTHGGPTSAFIHILIALCLLIPRLLLESKLIKNGNLPRENIWHTELNFMLTHRDRLVVLSFATSPYQNNTIDDDTINKNRIYRPTYGDDIDDDISQQTHLIEKFHPGGGGLFDDSDYFDTHEKMEIEKVTTSTQPPHTTLSAPARDKGNSNRMFVTSPTNELNNRNEMPSNTEIADTQTNNNNGGNRKQNGRQKNRNNRKYANKERSGEKNQRRGEIDSREKQKKYVDADTYNNEFATKIPPRRTGVTVMRIEPSEDIPIDTPFDGAGKKSTIIRDSNIHIVKPADGGFQPVSTPFSTNSKIIEIKPSTIRTSKRVRRASLDTLDAGIEVNAYGSDDEMFGIIDDEDVPEPRIYVNVDSNSEQFIEDEDENVFLSKPAPDAIAAALIGAASIPANVTTSSTTASAEHKELNGFAACLQHYLNVNKEVDTKTWTSNIPSFEFMNFVVALIVWSSRYPSVFWTTSKPFAIVFSIQMIANGIDLLLGFAGVSVIYKLKIVGQQLPLQTPPMLLNGIVSLLLYVLSLLLITSSSMILYLYGHGRLSSRVRDRRMVSTKIGDTWAYFAHCASLCFILALAVVKAPLMHDFTAIYKGSLDTAVLVAALSSVMHIFFWILLWLGLTAKRRWNFKLPPLNDMHLGKTGASMPLLMSPQMSRHSQINGSSGGANDTMNESSGEETIYWPKLAPNSPKLKVTFNDVPSTLSDNNLADEHDDGKRNSSRRTSICITGEIDEGDYATLRAAPSDDLMHFNFSSIISASNCDTADDTSEEGKLLDCVRDDSVTYASTRDLEPPMPPPPPPLLDEDCNSYDDDGSEMMPNPMPPVIVTVHTIDSHVLSMPQSRSFRRGDSGMPNDVLSPHSESTSTDCSTSPPERTTSDHSSSSGIHSGEEREEVVIRPRHSKIITNPTSVTSCEELFGRSTNMKMSSFAGDLKQSNSSATLPIHRAIDMQHDFINQFSTMPLPINCHQQQQYHTQQFHTPNASKTQLHHTTLPNDVRYANPTNFMRRVPLHVQTAESPYGLTGLGAGHHTFSKLLHEPLIYNSIPEDRDSANCSMISEQEMYANATSIGQIH